MATDLCKHCKVCKACGKIPYKPMINPPTGKLSDYPSVMFMGLRYEPVGDEEHF